MSLLKYLSEDFFKLFVKREGKVVLGKRFSNLWLLVCVLTLTFLAIAFSNASLDYLSYKMNDPFINWVDIQNDYGEGNIDGLLDGLSDTTMQRDFHFVTYQVDYTNHYMFFGKDDSQIQYLNCRFFQAFEGNPLLHAILGEDNVVDNASIPVDQLADDMIGVIVTKDVVNKMGYVDDYPSYLNMCRYSSGADTLGFNLYQGFARVPVPVLAVVKRLPKNMDIIATRFFYEQQRNDMTYPFNLNNVEYASSLYYYVPEGADKAAMADFLRTEGGDTCYVRDAYLPRQASFRNGSFISLQGRGGKVAVDVAWRINDDFMSRFGEDGVIRVYDYDFSDYTLPQGSFISVQFNDLNRIRDFESFVKDTYKVKIEMSQINAKENFNSVSIMANILSWAIIAFSIICIILFIVNLLQSYFQKVKKNLGTFKAFGISNKELIGIYMLIMMSTIIAAMVTSLALIWSIQLILPQLGVLKDGSFNYLTLWNSKTVYSIIVILVSSAYTVFLVMKRLLAATPGDLIYDRQ